MNKNNKITAAKKVIQKELCGVVKSEYDKIRCKEEDYVEYALQGEGQNNVLPPSKHPPDDSDNVEVLKSCIKHMVDDKKKVSDTVYGEAKKKAQKILQKLSDKCPKFKKILYEQKEGSLDKENWFRWVCFFTKLEQYEVAMFFSQLSTKHDKKSEKLIEEKMKEAKQSAIEVPKCAEFGCGEKEIFSCFGRFNMNEKDEIVNCPAMLLMNDKEIIKKQIEKAKKQLDSVLMESYDDKYAFVKYESMANITKLYNLEPSEALRMIDKISRISKVSQNEIKKEIKKFNQKRQKAQEKAIAKIKAHLVNIGFIFDDKGKFKKLNENIFARHINENFDFAFFNEDTFYEYNETVWQEVTHLALSKKLRLFLHKYLDCVWTTLLEESYIEALKREVDYVKEMNAHREYINVKNGLLNLNTFKLEKHRKDIYSSIQIPINYNPCIDCTEFKKYLNDIFEGDRDRIMLVQEMLGYCLTETRAQKGFILLGEGSNGKSILCDVMHHLYGRDNISNVSMKDLNNSFPRYNLLNKTVNISTENEVDSRGLNTQYLKAITTGDIIYAEEKYKQGISFKPFCKLVFAVNKLPYSKDNSYGFLRRLEIIPFDVKYKLELSEQDKKNSKIRQADPNLLDKLLNELDGIFNFAIEGLKRLEKNNYRFTKAKVSNRILENYKEEINVMLQFTRENIEVASKEKRIVRGEIRKTFDEWCDENRHKGTKDMNSKKFWNEFRKTLENEGVNYHEKKSNGKDYFYGIQLIPKALSEVDVNGKMLLSSFRKMFLCNIVSHDIIF